MAIEGTFPVLLTVGKLLSVAALILVLAAIVSVWRRPSFPAVAYGGVPLSTRRLRWVWFLVLTGALGFSMNEDPTASSMRSMEDPEAAEGVSTLTTVGVSVPLPFYRYERERVFGDGKLVEEHILEGFLLPWPLISALIAYLVIVLRWNPESPWARRILQGRKWRAEEGAGAG